MANLSQQKREKLLSFLKTLEEKNKDDDEALRALGEIETELESKHYGLIWEKHEEAVDVKLHDFIPVFKEEAEKEIVTAPRENYNFLLEGDNLHSLKLLEKTHKGRVDVIYIDPPYNTGKKGDFIYNDAFVDENDTFRHSKWLSFMNERLLSARTLLKDEGFIFISIDDGEQAALKLLCDKIFGENNFIANLIWEKKYTVQNDAHFFSDNHDFILCYAKNVAKAKIGKLPRTEQMNRAYKNPDNDKRGPWKSTPLHAKSGTNTSAYTFPNGVVFTPPDGSYRRFNDESMQRMYENNEIWFGKNGNAVPSRKTFLSEISSANGVVPRTILKHEVAGLNSDGVAVVKDIFGGNNIFSNPKPVKLIRLLITLGAYQNKDAIVLDFFAGSGTTAQAVLELNQEDGGHRNFILCTNNENSICENITYPRIKTVITGIRQDGSKYSDGIPANLKYYKTDFVSRASDSLTEDLLEHTKEMIQLENRVKVDNIRYFILFSDEEADALAAKRKEYPEMRAIYISNDVLLSTEDQIAFQGVSIIEIPDYYFKFELLEAGER